jgi:hypothetical protein
MDQISYFEVRKLHGYKNYKLRFNNNQLILIGKNGVGKTSVLRTFFYTFSCKWKKLANMDFEKIKFEVNKTTYEFSKSDVDKYLNSRTNSSDYSDYLKDFLHSRLSSDDPYTDMSDEYYNNSIRNYLTHSKISPKKELSNIAEIDKFLESLNLGFIYLPTYRRIEQELDYVLKLVGYPSNYDEYNKFYIARNSKAMSPLKEKNKELVEFGMNDVFISVERHLSHLKEYVRLELNNLTMGYLGDIVDDNYLNVNVDEIKAASYSMIDDVISRIDEKILKNDSKIRLYNKINSIKEGNEVSNQDKIICHYFSKLLNFQKDLEIKEERIKAFCDVCNRYFVDKMFVYQSSDFTFDLLYLNEDSSKKHQKTIVSSNDFDDVVKSRLFKSKLNQLSSGEKQLVSLFSLLYLSNNQNNYLIIIDEPELSLSVTWQQNFLVDVINGKLCAGIFVATHSPFIYENDLLTKYAHSIEEFKK